MNKLSEINQQVRGGNSFTVDLHGVQSDHNSGSIVLTANGSYEVIKIEILVILFFDLQ